MKKEYIYYGLGILAAVLIIKSLTKDDVLDSAINGTPQPDGFANFTQDEITFDDQLYKKQPF
jgi:hypothetical protein